MFYVKKRISESRNKTAVTIMKENFSFSDSTEWELERMVLIRQWPENGTVEWLMSKKLATSSNVFLFLQGAFRYLKRCQNVNYQRQLGKEQE